MALRPPNLGHTPLEFQFWISVPVSPVSPVSPALARRASSFSPSIASVCLDRCHVLSDGTAGGPPST